MSCERCSAPAGVEQSGEAVGVASGHVGRPRRGVAHHSEVSVPLMSVRRPYLHTRLLHPFICQKRLMLHASRVVLWCPKLRSRIVVPFLCPFSLPPPPLLPLPSTVPDTSCV